MDNKLTFPFIKSVALNDLPPEAWINFTGGDGTVSGLQKYYKAIPWLFRGVNIRANAVAAMPFAIFKGDTEIDNSDDYQNKVGFMPNPGALFGLIEAALTIWGYSYLFRKANDFGFSQGLRYLLSSSVTCAIDPDTGEPTFTRTVNGKPKDYSKDEIVYFWTRDPFVEKGPPASSPAQAAANAAGVLLNIDLFASAFFERGAIKATLLTTENIVPQERDRLKAWWNRMFTKGNKSSWQTDIINAKAITPVVVGEGLESLDNKELSESKRTDIAAALGIPYSVLFSNASNRATAEQDDVHLYTKTIIPDSEFIAGVLNDQELTQQGYKLVMQPQKLTLFQTDENERAESLTQLVASLAKPEEFLLAADILGFDLDPKTRANIEKLATQRAQAREAMPEQPVTVNNTPQTEPQNTEQRREPQETPGTARAADLQKWQMKAIKLVRKGKPAACPFDSDHIDIVTAAAIGAQLETAASEDDVKAVFADVWRGYP